MTYVVTGGAGFVGSNLVAALLAREPRARVVVIDNFRSGTFANIVEACERRRVGPFDGRIIAASTAELDWPRLLDEERPSAVFHLAAITDTTVADEAEMIRENVGGFWALLRACRKQIPPADLIYASSAATYGTPPQTRDQVPFPLEAAGRPNNIYGFSKWLMECKHRNSGQRAVGFRFFNVFGPGEARKGKMASIVHQVARQILAGTNPRLFEFGEQARDQIHVDDVVDCMITAADRLRAWEQTEAISGGANRRRWHCDPGGVYNLGSGVATTFNQIVDAVREGLGVSAQERPTDYFPMPADIRAFYQDYTCADMSQTEKNLGWKPRRDPREAMREYAAYLGKRSR